MVTTIDVGTIAEYTCDETWGDKAGQILTGDVVKAGKTYADVTWREGRTERIHFRNKHEMSAITFTTETDEQVAEARHEQFMAALPLLYRRTDQDRIELAHDADANLVHRGQRTSRWYRTVTAALRARTVEIDRMVAALRPGDRVRQTDDPNGTVWTVREVRDGSDGWVWLSLRRTPENGTEIWTGCRARAVDLVTPATDDQHTAEIEAKLHDDHRSGWITDDEYTAGLQALADELYTFAGDGPDKPPYWVIRRGRVVTHILGREIRTSDCTDIPTARATLADQSCDPYGLGAPQPGDTIKIHWGDHAHQHLVVTTVTRPDDEHFAIEAALLSGTRIALTVAAFQYGIVRRPPSTTQDS